MKAIILAAGRGTRISREIEDRPKCTVPVEPGLPLIEYTVRLLNLKGIRDIEIIVGYKHQAIRDALSGYQVTFTVNPFFDVTNSIASMWFGREVFETSDPDGFLIMNGDVYLSENALAKTLACGKSPVMFYDSSRIEGSDYRFQVDGDVLKKYGKELSLAETSGEYVGCARFSAEYAPVFTDRLDELIHSQQHSMWWENVLYSLSHEHTIHVDDLSGDFWAEVDYIEDYRRILAFHQAENT